MRKSLIVLCFFLSSLYSFERKDRSTNAIPITKEAALKFKTLNEALGIPASYEVMKYIMMYIDSNATLILAQEENIQSLFSHAPVGIKVIFTSIVLKKGDRQIKLEDKVYIIK
jgi:hypothetical protein